VSRRGLAFEPSLFSRTAHNLVCQAYVKATQHFDVPITPDALGAVDRHGYEVLEALSPEDRSSATHSAAQTFVYIHGKTYWVKGRAQQGAGR